MPTAKMGRSPGAHRHGPLPGIRLPSTCPPTSTSCSAHPGRIYARHAAAALRPRDRAGPAAIAVAAMSSGRVRAQFIEDETYYWTVTRFLHDDPSAPPGGPSPGLALVRATRAMITGVAVLGWVAYDTSARRRCKPATAARTPAASDRRYVTAGLSRDRGGRDRR